MTEQTGKGAWMMRCTIDGKGGGTDWETYWDLDATPMSEGEAAARRRELMEILFAPHPDEP